MRKQSKSKPQKVEFPETPSEPDWSKPSAIVPPPLEQDRPKFIPASPPPRPIDMPPEKPREEPKIKPIPKEKIDEMNKRIKEMEEAEKKRKREENASGFPKLPNEPPKIQPASPKWTSPEEREISRKPEQPKKTIEKPKIEKKEESTSKK